MSQNESIKNISCDHNRYPRFGINSEKNCKGLSIACRCIGEASAHARSALCAVQIVQSRVRAPALARARPALGAVCVAITYLSLHLCNGDLLPVIMREWKYRGGGGGGGTRPRLSRSRRAFTEVDVCTRVRSTGVVPRDIELFARASEYRPCARPALFSLPQRSPRPIDEILRALPRSSRNYTGICRRAYYNISEYSPTASFFPTLFLGASCSDICK